jgi:hypothetical protein
MTKRPTYGAYCQENQFNEAGAVKLPNVLINKMRMLLVLDFQPRSVAQLQSGFPDEYLGFLRTVLTRAFFSGKILLEASKMVLSNLSKFGGTNLHLLHVVLLQCIRKNIGAFLLGRGSSCSTPLHMSTM